MMSRDRLNRKAERQGRLMKWVSRKCSISDKSQATTSELGTVLRQHSLVSSCYQSTAPRLAQSALEYSSKNSYHSGNCCGFHSQTSKLVPLNKSHASYFTSYTTVLTTAFFLPTLPPNTLFSPGPPDMPLALLFRPISLSSNETFRRDETRLMGMEG